MKILIGAINYNTYYFTKIWLETLYKSIQYALGKGKVLINSDDFQDIRVVIVDNGSNDVGQLEEFLKTYPYPVTFIKNEKNIGVSPAWNQIIKSGYSIENGFEYEYYIPANNDIYFSEHWLSNFIDCLQENHGEYGWINGLLEDHADLEALNIQEIKQVHATYWSMRPEADTVINDKMMVDLLKTVFGPWGGVEKFAEKIETKNQNNKLIEMSPKAPLFALSKGCLEKVGLFDEYNTNPGPGIHEDCSMTLRIARAGFKLGCAMTTWAFHYACMSRTKGEERKEWWVEGREKAFQEMWGVSSKETHLINKDYKFKLDLGGGEYPQKGAKWKAMDIDPQFPFITYLHDCSKPLPFEDGEFEEIYSSNCLEHIFYKEVPVVLFEWCRVLCSGGKIHLRVPNFRKVMEWYVNRQWQMSFIPGSDLNAMHIVYGGDHDGLSHRHGSAYDFDTLSDLLKYCGIINIINVSDPNSWELRLEGIKQ